jgi:hypothetical protein
VEFTMYERAALCGPETRLEPGETRMMIVKGGLGTITALFFKSNSFTEWLCYVPNSTLCI